MVTSTLAGRRFIARHGLGVRVFRITNAGAPEPWLATTAYWFAWPNFFPRSRVVR